MQNNWRVFFEKCKNPPMWVQWLTYLITLLSGAGSIVLVVIKKESFWFSILEYACFAIAALSLTYAIFLTVLHAARLKRWIVRLLNSHELTRRVLENFGFRTVLFSTISFLMSIAFGAFNAYLGATLRSIWYGALAAYYIFLALVRGGILVHHQRVRKGDKTERETHIKQIKTYRNSGIVMLLLNAALSSAIAQMIFDDQHFSYDGWIIYAYAAYAFYKITMAIINLVRARKEDDLTVRAIRSIHLIDAAVSILALQTAMLVTFGEVGMDISLFNTLTGCAVSILAVGISIFMIINGSKALKKVRENRHGE